MKQDNITAKAIRPSATHIEVRIPWVHVRQLQNELQKAYDASKGSQPLLAMLLDQLEEAVDREAGVERVGAARAS
jgi:hypothetical protein